MKPKDILSGRPNNAPDLHWNLGLLSHYNFQRGAGSADKLELQIKAVWKFQRKLIGQTKGVINGLHRKPKSIPLDLFQIPVI